MQPLFGKEGSTVDADEFRRRVRRRISDIPPHGLEEVVQVLYVLAGLDRAVGEVVYTFHPEDVTRYNINIFVLK